MENITTEELEMIQQANQRFEEAIQHCMKNGFPSRRAAEKWLIKRHHKMVAKLHKQAMKNANKEKPLYKVEDEVKND